MQKRINRARCRSFGTGSLAPKEPRVNGGLPGDEREGEGKCRTPATIILAVVESGRGSGDSFVINTHLSACGKPDARCDYRPRQRSPPSFPPRPARFFCWTRSGQREMPVAVSATAYIASVMLVHGLTDQFV